MASVKEVSLLPYL